MRSIFVHVLSITIAALSSFCMVREVGADKVKPTIVQENFNKIDKHLTKHVSTDDTEANLDQAAAWLKELETKPSSCFTFNRMAKLDLIRALTLFVSMKESSNPENCWYDTREMMMRNYAAAGRPSFVEGRPPGRRVERIVYHLVKQYHEMCNPDYISNYVDGLPVDVRSHIISIGGVSIEYDVNGVDLSGVKRLIKGHIGTNNGGREDEIRRIFDEYLIKPCKILKQDMGDLFFRYSPASIPHFDITAEVYEQMFKKRRAAFNCRLLLEKTSLILEGVLPDGTH